MERIYCFLPSALRAGQIYRGESLEAHGDVFLWGEAETEDELIDRATATIKQTEQDPRPNFSRKCAYAVLEYLGVHAESGS